MQVPSLLLEEIDYQAVVRAELSARNRFLPPNYADESLLTKVDELTRWLRTTMRRPFTPVTYETVLARKLGGGSRPLPSMALRDRLIYRALVSLIAPHIPKSRGEGAYDDFVNAPLENEECRFVLKTDVAAFYQYIDHERLIDEVIAQTGDDLAVVAAVELLQEVTQRRFGLPQMSDPSDTLGEVYVDPIRRELIRSGFQAFRFADDFRVACKNYNQALQALELVERSAFDLGLVLNEAKTTTPRRETYEEALTESSAAERELFELLPDGTEVPSASEPPSPADFMMIPGFEEYDDVAADGQRLGVWAAGEVDDEEDPPTEHTEPEPPTATQVAAARRLLDLWSSEDDEMGWGRAVWSTLVRKALAVLKAVEDPYGVEAITSLVVHEPHLTPQICGYISALARSEPEMMSGVLDQICARQIVSVWQSLWVAHCAGTFPVEADPSATHVDWLREQLTSDHSPVAACAALALAQRRLLTVEEAARTYERVGEVHKPTALLALAGAHGSRGSEVVVESRIERWQVEWVAAQPWGQPPRRRLVRVSRKRR